MNRDELPRSARTEDLAAAFRLIFQDLPFQDRDNRVANALHLIQRGELDPNGVFVLAGATGLLGALVSAPVPGGAALIWPPGCVGGERRIEREDRLLQHASAWLRGRGVKLVQALLSSDEKHLATSLERNAFVCITTLWYMRHNLEVPVGCLDTPARLHFQAYDPDNPGLFHRTLERTYENTLDCPEINGLRTIEEVIQGHRSQGDYDPDHWWLAWDGDRPVAVLLTMSMPETGDWEVSYMGVVRSARRCGFGREVLLKALFEARAADVPRVTLSVDERNRPAWELYRQVGFEPYDQRAVYLAVWR
jgi:ribosomal protein S18 acetylase RimI-like enzyme